ncbi:hypothetical protein J5N97_019005 [Dioscorea zingiberensis]|uniref:Uncharacterized protein n=1 Tax=Dioscorea zingiberensis TaxID=325984 RepID=A0A9D5CD59_9LILI|nr:hypothetical protein J5N97_019005 [Dioscorea zingiberensis]
METLFWRTPAWIAYSEENDFVHEKIAILRYSDFVWLRGRLAEKFKGIFIPSLLKKSTVDIIDEICKDNDSIFEVIDIDLNELESCGYNEEDGCVPQEVDTQQFEDGHETAAQDGQELAMSPQSRDE